MICCNRIKAFIVKYLYKLSESRVDINTCSGIAALSRTGEFENFVHDCNDSLFSNDSEEIDSLLEDSLDDSDIVSITDSLEDDDIGVADDTNKKDSLVSVDGIIRRRSDLDADMGPKPWNPYMMNEYAPFSGYKGGEFNLEETHDYSELRGNLTKDKDQVDGILSRNRDNLFEKGHLENLKHFEDQVKTFNPFSDQSHKTKYEEFCGPSNNLEKIILERKALYE